MNFFSKNILLVLFCGLAVSPSAESAEKWNVPRVGHVLEFPRDHGSHPDFKIEWWYLTGHLMSADRRFGFQATFFRLGQKPEAVAEGDLFGESQIYMAHMGISDPMTGAFLHETRLNRGGWDAGAAQGDLDVFNGNWSLRRKENGMQLEGSIRSEASFSITLEPRKKHVIFGEEGISRKGPEGTAASYYITFPRLSAKGSVRIGTEEFPVQGEAWMDHEISSSQLDRNQIGWDWACLQFEDGREIMGYVLRTDDGGVSDYSKLVWISESGELTHLQSTDYTWHHEGIWKSPKTEGEYPISPLIETLDPRDNSVRKFRLRPIMKEQEMVGSGGGVSYWEGACDIIDEESGDVLGRAYLEMTGYADDIAEKLR